MVSGSIVSTSLSRITITMGAPQSRQGASILIVFPGKSQRTASASNPHWANHFCSPSIEMRYWLGRLLKGATETIWSVSGCMKNE